MAQIIKHRRGSLEALSSVTSSLQKGELVFATGSSNLSVNNGSSLAFIVPENGQVQATNRFLVGDANPAIFSASVYNGMVKGVPYYASGSHTLYLLGSDGNEAINLVGNIQPFSGSVNTRLSDLEASIGGGATGIGTRVTALEASQSYFDGTFSGSVATQLSASVATVTANSASSATSFSASAASQTALSSSVATSFSASAASVSNLSSSVASDLSTLSASIYQTDATQSDAITANSQSAATSFSASYASQTALSSSVATSFSASSASQTALSSSVATSFSASNASIASLSASVASVTGDFSSSVATSFSASAASVAALSASISTTDSASAAAVTALSTSVDARLDAIEFLDTTFATTGSNTFQGTQTITGSLYITQNLVVYGSSSVQNITASAASLGTNTIILNTANPAFRFGGVSVVDSGSAANTGSLFWDSEKEHWIYQRSETGSYGSAMLIAGPKNTGSLGDEQGLTVGYVPVAVGDDHIGNSIISASATIVNIAGGLDVTGNISSSTISGIGNVSAYSQSVDSRVATLETSLGGGGSIGTRVANLESISASYLTFTSSYYSDSASFQAGIDGAYASASAYSASAATALSASDFTQTLLSASVATSFSASAASQNVLSASVATSFSASAASVTSLSASAASALSSVSGAVATDINNLSASIYQTDVTQSNAITNNSASFATALSASAASVTSLSSSVATSFSASYVSITSLSASIASTDATQTANITTAQNSADGAFASASAYSASAATDLTNVSSSFATQFSASYALVSNNSASAASALNGLSSSVATSFSASAASQTALSSSLASRVSTLEGSGSIQSLGTANDVTFNSVNTAGDVIVGGNLVVNGTTTALNTAQLYVEDKLITLASGSTSGATSDGAGIEIAGTAASLTFNNGATAFSSSIDIIAPAVTASVNLGTTAGSTKRVAFRNTNGNLDLVAAPTTAGDLVQWDGTDFIMSNTIDGGAF